MLTKITALFSKALAFLTPTIAKVRGKLAAVPPRVRLLVLAVVAVLLALAVGFAWGRHTAPAHVETRTVTVDRTVYKDRIVEKRVEVAAEQKVETRRVLVYRDRVIAPDGTKTTHEQISSQTDLASAAERAAQAESVRTVTETKTQTVTQKVEVDRRTTLILQGLAGLSLTGPTYGGAVSYRLAGPLYVGAWGLSVPAGGVSVGLGF